MMSVVQVAGAAYDALSAHDMALLFMGMGVLGVVLYLLILLSYLYVPIIKAQHPAADIVVWHVVSGLMSCVGFIVAYANTAVDPAKSTDSTCSILALYNQFWLLGGCLWYFMLTLDLLVALVNPWMGYACKSWAYHSIVWGVSLAGVITMRHYQLAGISSVNVCWIKRTAHPSVINRFHWILLFGPVVGTFVTSFAVLLFASVRFVRRQLDVTYRTKRRILLQYYRYLFVFGVHWSASGALYYADYRQHFSGATAAQLQLAFGIVFGSYPFLLMIVWLLNTELYQHRSSENSLTSAEREAESVKAEHFSAALRKDLMRYTTAGIRCSINDELFGVSSGVPGPRSPPYTRSRLDSIGSSIGYFSGDEGLSLGPAGLYSEKKRLATTVYNGEYRYYEKLGFTDYAPKIFENIREACGIDNTRYEKSFACTLLERASEGKSGMLFYFTSDRKYLVKTMTKREHSFLLKILPLYHQYVLRQPNTLLCRFLGCHSMQLPVGWNKMFFVVMENVFSDGPVDERYDLKGIFHQAAADEIRSRGVLFPPLSDRDVDIYDARALAMDMMEGESDCDEMTSPSSSFLDRHGDNAHPEMQPLLKRATSRSSLRHDTDLVCRRASLRVNATTRANLLAQITNDCGFLQELGIMDYSFLVGVQKHSSCLEPSELEQLAHNAVVSDDKTVVYYLGFVDILQHYNVGWKLQHWLLSAILDKRKITALPPAEYALRFLGFIHAYLLCDRDVTMTRSYGSVDMSMFATGSVS